MGTFFKQQSTMKVLSIVALLIFASKLAFGDQERAIPDLTDEQLKNLEELLDELSESEIMTETDLTEKESEVFEELSNLPPLLQSGQGSCSNNHELCKGLDSFDPLVRDFVCRNDVISANCKKSCGGCPDSCSDSHEACSMFANVLPGDIVKFFCENLEVISSHCKKSCGTCP